MAKDTKVRCSFKLSLSELNSNWRNQGKGEPLTQADLFHLASSKGLLLSLNLPDGRTVYLPVNLSYISIE